MNDEHLGLSRRYSFAALVHGVVILGVTFTAATVGDDEAVPSLNVTLVLDTGREELAAETADFIANRDQLGAAKRPAARGRRARCRRTSRRPSSAIRLGADARDGTPRDATPSAEQLVSRGSGGEPRARAAAADRRARTDAATAAATASASRAANDGRWSSACAQSCPTAATTRAR